MKYASRKLERDVRLDCILQEARAKPAYTAGWLHGSLGRGTADGLSDIDIWLVVKDQDFTAVAKDRHTIAGLCGRLIGWVEAEQNAPPGGAYLHGLYEGETGLHIVDWYWQSACSAVAPETDLLFQRQPFFDSPLQDQPRFELPQRTDYEDARNRTLLAASMITIQAKYLARNVDSPLELANFILKLLDKKEEDFREPISKMQYLRSLACTLRERCGEFSIQAVAPSQVDLFLDYIESSEPSLRAARWPYMTSK